MNYSNSNYGANTMAFRDLKNNVYYFSYKTMVAFKPAGKDIKVIQNYWGSTTGKHLNWIDGGNKKERLGKFEFNLAYNMFLEGQKNDISR